MLELGLKRSVWCQSSCLTSSSQMEGSFDPWRYISNIQKHLFVTIGYAVKHPVIYKIAS